MKIIKLNNKLLFTVGLLTLLISFNSCNDFLDRPPLSSVGPGAFLNSESDLASYPLSYYGSVFSTHSGWGVGIGNMDNGTDNQATANPNLNLYTKGTWLVPNNSDLGFGTIRGCNYFLEQVLPKWKAGNISGNTQNINHYIGEMYMIRAMAYFDKLDTYGDFPIVKTTLPDQEDILIASAKRAPRNLVARQILSDLDSAILLLSSSTFNKVRITKEAALIAKSRVALYEASFLTYHKGTPRVPGGPQWPGASMEYNKDFKIDIDAEINFFLDQAMASAKEVADKIQLTSNSGVTNPPSRDKFSGWNPYFEMFGSKDLSKFPEVVLWRQYNVSLGIAHGVSIYIERGGNTGYTKSMVDSYLMSNGLPWYAAGSGYQGDVKIMDVKKDRDQRLQLFLAGETDIRTVKKDADYFGEPTIINIAETRDVTGYRSRKFLNYDPTEAPGSDLTCVSGSIVFRAAEAYLNYIEASYMKKKSIDGDADKYWRALRTRAGVDPDYTKTIAVTVMDKEKNDWGAYSGGTLVDATLYNIRRERRNELASEGFRYNDLVRWRAMDQVSNYIVEGFNLWDQAYSDPFYTNPKPGEVTSAGLIDDGSAKANVSNKSLSKYLRPYQIVNLSTNLVFNGYNWSKANYLSPIPYRQMQLASPTGDAANSNLYQNPYWPAEANAPALE
ncbi:MAG: RagB/SusD family nutrient uptake outer membrane protein [Paludibacteraceae bacterium]